MKKNGFTLIELLITIAIIGILGVIAGGAIINSLGGAKEDINEVQEQMIISAAKLYVIDNPCSSECFISVDTLVNEGYLDEAPDSEAENQIGAVEVNFNETTKKYSYTATSFKVEPVQFIYSGSVITYTISETGTYTIKAAGAEGTAGNNYSYTGENPPGGGKGASISATFSLSSGDELSIVVGGQGSVTQSSAKDGTSGAGGGGSFVFKKIDSITDSTYQFTKDSSYYEVLLVAAGGGGSTDNSYKGTSALAGSDGIGATWITPEDEISYSTQTTAGTTTNTSSSLSNVLSINQFINYGLAGGYYTRNSGKCFGGFGGGGCADDNKSYGGGWSKGTTTYTTTSFSSGSNTSGVTGAQSGNGYVKIYKN